MSMRKWLNCERCQNEFSFPVWIRSHQRFHFLAASLLCVWCCLPPFSHFTLMMPKRIFMAKKWNKNEATENVPFNFVRTVLLALSNSSLSAKPKNLIEKRKTEVSHDKNECLRNRREGIPTHYSIEFFYVMKNLHQFASNGLFMCGFFFCGLFSISLQFHTTNTTPREHLSTFHCSMPTNELIMCKINFYRFGCQKRKLLSCHAWFYQLIVPLAFGLIRYDFVKWSLHPNDLLLF